MGEMTPRRPGNVEAIRAHLEAGTLREDLRACRFVLDAMSARGATFARRVD